MSKRSRPSNRAWYWAIFTCFFLHGALFATWASRTPEIKTNLGLNTAQMGLFTLVMAIGSLCGLLLGGRFVPQVGAKRTILIAYTVTGLSMVTLGFTTTAGNLPLAVISIAALGASLGSGGIAINMESAAIDHTSEKSLLPSFHGSYSTGNLGGAALGTLLIFLVVPIPLQFAAIGCGFIIIAFIAARSIPHDSGKTVTEDMSTEEIATIPSKEERRRALRNPRAITISFIVLGFALAEGAASAWLPISLTATGMTDAAAAGCYTMFAAAMAIARLSGGPVVDKFGRSRLLLLLGIVAISGISIVMMTNVIHLPYLGAFLWGLGCSLGFPLCVSAITDEKRFAQTRVQMIFFTANVAGLTGPPVLGGLGQLFGLFTAFGLPVTLMIGGLFANKATRPIDIVDARR
ncbi:MFS transporter [Aurantimicrobium minutum]|uniref:MFS transporter n=1 Tax=Aurantimicrobium minutum TaxID=708131 RepID=UPI002474A6D3|nr:MFS transporter [Aurantimicrobium minutum]MDH6422621.1 MFS family permease [Aurantimicrobium minutum]